VLFAVCGSLSVEDDNVQLGLRVPAGFEVTEFAGPDLASDIFSLTIDSRGRIVVSGAGYVRVLADDDQDGRADRAMEFAAGPADGALGMLWEGSSLFVSGGGGLRRYRDENGDDRADGPGELIRSMKTGGEHDAHDIKRGRDGWLYVLCGNMTGIDKSFAQLESSPIQDPVAGCVVRFSPDFSSSEIVARGFRNAYRMDFNGDGELFTYDSDNERCVSLPWYEPTRFYHVISGCDYGWQSPQIGQWFRLPPYFPDVVAPVANLGRGSPTGVVCYRRYQFPETYHGGMFAADWTFGRVYFLPLERSGASYTSKPQTFIEAVGENGFAPTDLVVHPATGDLFLSIGGRGTRGAVYRVRYCGPSRTAQEFTRRTPEQKDREPDVQRLDWRPELERLLPQLASSDDGLQRLRALTLIRRHRQHFKSHQLSAVVRANAGNSDRNIRFATAKLMASLGQNELRSLEAALHTPREAVTYSLAMALASLPLTREENDVGDRPVREMRLGAPGLTKLALVLEGAGGFEQAIATEQRLEAVRVLQLIWGGITSPRFGGTIWEAYSPRRELAELQKGIALRTSPDTIEAAAERQVIKALLGAFPSGHAELDRELARSLALIKTDDPRVSQLATAKLTDSSSPIDDIHFLAVLACLNAEPTPEDRAIICRTLLGLDRKITEHGLHRDRHWPLRVAELHGILAEKDPVLNESILADNEFGRPDHALFAQCSGFDRRRAAQVFVNRSARDSGFAWTPALVQLLSALPESESAWVLRKLWDNLGLREAIVAQLARNPKDEDRERFLESLSSPYLATVGMCLNALQDLPAATNPVEYLTLVRAMRRLRGGKEEDKLRERVGEMLRQWTQQDIAVSDAGAWSAWLAQAHPGLAARLEGSDAADLAAWKLRLERLDWSEGIADRGRVVYERTGCVACHSGNRAMGPDLRGVANRFSRDDLFTAILQPGRDVSPRYQTTLVSTSDGKIYQGTIVYDAVDSLILQTGTDTTVRITNNQVAERRVTTNSLMPAGLLDKLTDRETADLFAYLKTLR
jgi:putative heme-binding domain-containing protein